MAWPYVEVVIASALATSLREGAVKLFGTTQALSALFLAATMAAAPLALADDLGSPPPLEPGASADWTEVNQVLEIPQQCDKDAVAMLCDRGEAVPAPDDPFAAADPNAQSPADAQAAQDAAQAGNYGSIEDYENQYATAETANGALFVPAPVYVPMRPMYLSPPPVVINPPRHPGPYYLRPLPFHHRFGGSRFRGR
jgi:hypothetical protein